MAIRRFLWVVAAGLTVAARAVTVQSDGMDLPVLRMPS